MTHRHCRAWTEEEEAALLARYDGTDQSARLLGEELGRSPAAVKSRACFLGLAIAKPRWTEEENRILAAEYPDPSVDVGQLAKRLGRTPGSLRAQAHFLRLCKRRAWTAEEDEIALVTAGIYGGAAQAAEQIGRTAAAVRQRRKQIRLQQAAS